MKSNLLRSAIATAALGLFSLAASAGTINYSYTQSEELYQWGLKTAQTYDIAIKIDGSFADMKVNTISVPVIITENIGQYQLWLTSTLAIDDVDGKKVNRTDIMCQEVEPVMTNQDYNMGYIAYTLPEGYTIPATGLYVGYSFTVNKVGSDTDRYPVLVTIPGIEGGFYVHTSRTYRAWKDRSTEVDAVSAIVVTLEADFSENAAGLTAPTSMLSETGKGRLQSVTVSNRGTKEISSIGYTLTVDGTAYNGEYTFNEPIVNVYNRSNEALIEVPAMGNGVYDYTLEITTVNGQPNGIQAKASGRLHVVDVLPVKRPLMEEYTGTWCGWCPRGWIAMEKMSELHSDFVAIAYHNGDAMQIPNYPAMESGYPSAFMDRSISADPYYGINNAEFGIEKLWQDLCQESTPAALTLEATLSEDGTQVNVTSDVFWAMDAPEGSYSVEYVLVGDGMSDQTWVQTNNYASYNAGEGGIYMDIFCKGGEYGKSRVVGLVYNDVALINSGGRGVAGSIESTEGGSHNIYNYTFDLSKSSIVDKAEKLNVVAMILKDNGQYGKVINSNKTAVLSETTAIGTIATDSSVVSEQYYDLTGRQVVNPVNGSMYIHSVRYSDGQVKNTKIVK